MNTRNAEIQQHLARRYEAGFVTDIESDTLPPGLNEDVVRFISAKKNEPEWLTEWRLKAYRHWLTMTPPHWAKLEIAPIDFQAISYFSRPKNQPKSLDEVDPKLLETYDRLGVPLHERARLAGVAVDAVFDSVSVGTTFRKELAEKGIVFCSMSEAIREQPELVKRYLGSVVPVGDNYFAALNSAVFSDGSFEFEARDPAKARGRRPSMALRVLGAHPKDKKPVELHAGRFGPYVKHGDINATIPDGDQADALTLDDAVQLLAAKAARDRDEAGQARAERAARPAIALAMARCEGRR